jgi:hypothetical protein
MWGHWMALEGMSHFKKFWSGSNKRSDWQIYIPLILLILDQYSKYTVLVRIMEFLTVFFVIPSYSAEWEVQIFTVSNAFPS